jgi:ribonuclease T2
LVRRVRSQGPLLSLVAATCASICCSAAATPPPVATAPFDYYVLTLSWSPGFCDLGGDRKSPQQCEPGAGDGFVIHGLWPNNRSGPNPEECDYSDLGSAQLSSARDLYPSLGLARYEYRKHGTCTGLSPRDYFDAVRYARDQILIPRVLQSPQEAQQLSPRDLQRAFIDANTNLRPTSVAVTCVRGELVDIRICLTPDLRGFAPCPRVTSRTCRSDSIRIAPVR